MLIEELKEKLKKKLSENPKEAVRIIEEDPQILRFLLDSDSEKIKYIKMTQEMEARLKETSEKLNVTQGWLIGAGILLFLSLLEKEK